jgi:hypothetical protein
LGVVDAPTSFPEELMCEVKDRRAHGIASSNDAISGGLGPDRQLEPNPVVARVVLLEHSHAGEEDLVIRCQSTFFWLGRSPPACCFSLIASSASRLSV